MAILLAVGASTLASSDFTIAAGGSALVRLYGSASGAVPADANCSVEYKVGSIYVPYTKLTGKLNENACIIQGDALAATTWRVVRNLAANSNASFGVDQA